MLAGHRLTNDCECYFGSFGTDLDALDCRSGGRQARSHGDGKADTKTHQERENGPKWSQADTTRPKAAFYHLRLTRSSLSGDSISVVGVGQDNLQLSRNLGKPKTRLKSPKNRSVDVIETFLLLSTFLDDLFEFLFLFYPLPESGELRQHEHMLCTACLE